MKKYLGIDPGKSGAFTILDENRNVIEIIDMPVCGKELDYNGIIEIFNKYPDAFICVEECQYTPALRGGKGCFTFGQVTGAIYGIIAGLQRPYERVKPQRWEREYNLHGKPKAESIAKAKQLFPDQNAKLLKPKDGRADSLLLAEYARRKF